MASAAVEKRQYLVRLLFMGFARNSSAGALSRKTCALAKPLFVLKLFQCHRSERSGIAHATLRKLDDLRATRRVAADSFTLGTEHKCGVTDTLDFFGRPTASTAERPRLCGRLFYARLPAPLPTHRGPVRDSQWPGRRNLPRRGTPRRAPVCCGGLMTPKNDLTYTQVTCLACAQAYLVNPKTGKVLGSDDE